MKGSLPYLPVLVSVLVILLILHIVLAKKNPVLELLQMEGFQAPILTVPTCPGGYKFFNDKDGASFCCKGTVNPYTHTCSAKGTYDMCAFEPDMRDPRNPNTVLSLCSSLFSRIHQENKNNLCPSIYPNYASNGRCCKNGTDLDGKNCIDIDNQNPRNYCIIHGIPQGDEQRCDALRRDEATTCPKGLQKVSYTLDSIETTKYGSSVKGLRIPICFNPTSSCIPETSLSYAQSQGAWTDKNAATWGYACANWTKKNIERDMTKQFDTSYP